jgi:peptidoglycan/xylan/chitin deacetylase (PgdA/CDA1 family)
MKLISKINKKISQLFHPPYGEILTLHRVVKERSTLNANRYLEITPAFLEQTILKYKSAGYRCVSLDEVQRQVESRQPGAEKFVCFTLDDGYADNYEQAYPVFQKHDCPFAIYVATDFPDRKAKLWWYWLEDLLMAKDRLTLNGVEYDCSDFEKKNRAFSAIRERIFTTEAETILNALEQSHQEIAGAARRDVDTLALTWEQIFKLAADPLCTIGSHTATHVSLPALSDERIRQELTEAKSKIEDRIRRPVRHFAYPYGNFDHRVARMVMKQYTTATIVLGDSIRKTSTLSSLNRNGLYQLPL